MDVQALWMTHRKCSYQTNDAQDRVLVRFGAVDYEVTLWVGGHQVGHHIGGHVPFDIDITNVLLESSDSDRLGLVMRVRDSPTDLSQPRGKQFWAAHPSGIMYTPTTGIWQSVWAEVGVPPTRIADPTDQLGQQLGGTVLRVVSLESGILQAQVPLISRHVGTVYELEIAATFRGHCVGSAIKCLGRHTDVARIELPLWIPDQDDQSNPDPCPPGLDNSEAEVKWYRPKPCERREAAPPVKLALWEPAHPSLYDVTIRLRERYAGTPGRLLDEVQMVAGVRDISWQGEDGLLRLNREPFFHALVLDQGYWPETGMTAPSPAALREDIVKAKAMGFDGCRKHQKIEAAMFTALADQLGFLVWVEMPSCFKFDSPTVTMARMVPEWTAVVMGHINHPSVAVWTPVNESWGFPDLDGPGESQRNVLSTLWAVTRALDPTRPVNQNCGWEHVVFPGHMVAFHDYEGDPAKLARSCSSRETILSGTRSGRRMYARGVRDRAGQPDWALAAGLPFLCTELGGFALSILSSSSSTSDSRVSRRDGELGKGARGSEPAGSSIDLVRAGLAAAAAGPAAGADADACAGPAAAAAWGYTVMGSPGEFLERFEQVISSVIFGGDEDEEDSAGESETKREQQGQEGNKKNNNKNKNTICCCGFTYTQLTDVETEINGLYTADRQAKVPARLVAEEIDRVRSRFLDLCRGGCESRVSGPSAAAAAAAAAAAPERTTLAGVA